MRRARHRADTTAKDLIATALQLGMLHQVQDGTIDSLLFIPSQQRIEIIDWKSSPKAPTTKAQRDLLDKGWPLRLISTVDELLSLLEHRA